MYPSHERYNKSEKGIAARYRWLKKDRANNPEKYQIKDAERVRDRKGYCENCGKLRWLIRFHPPTCRSCDRKQKRVGIDKGDRH